MQIYIHEVGSKGADIAFPRTIYKTVKTKDISKYTKNSEQTQKKLDEIFNDGFCNVWGAPKGAASVIRKLQIGDVVLLVKTRAGNGDIPILCKIKYIIDETAFELSKHLWNDARFPLIFLFESEVINYSWKELLDDLSYNPKWRPNGSIVRIIENRLNRHNGVKGFLKKIRKPQCKNNTNQQMTFSEGLRQTKEISFFSRNPKLVSIAKEIHGYRCHVCDFNFEEHYGEIGKGFIECHHVNPLSECEQSNKMIKTHIKDVITVCSNCHRMLHKRTPPFSVDELKYKFKRG